MLTTMKTPPCAAIDIMHQNMCIGYAMLEPDGFYYFLPRAKMNGLWAEHTLREIADLLRGLNAPFEKELKEYFDNLPKEISQDAQDEGFPF